MATNIRNCIKCNVNPAAPRGHVEPPPRNGQFMRLVEEIELLDQARDFGLAARHVGSLFCTTCYPDEIIVQVLQQTIDETLAKPTGIPILFDWVDDIDVSLLLGSAS